MNKLTVILMHHLDENRGYFDLAIRSLEASEGLQFETIVLADSETAPVVPESFRLIYDRDLNTATKKIHRGIKEASPDTTHYLILSDDVLVTRYTLHQLMASVGDSKMIMNPMCNGDQGTRFYAPIKIRDWMVPLHADLEDVKGREQDIIDYFTGISLAVPMPWLSFYCTLIPKTVWDQVGLLDERLETRGNDVDYCYRANALGIPSILNFSAFCFHFGSKTLSKIPMITEQQEAASRILQEKWAIR